MVALQEVETSFMVQWCAVGRAASCEKPISNGKMPANAPLGQFSTFFFAAALGKIFTDLRSTDRSRPDGNCARQVLLR